MQALDGQLDWAGLLSVLGRDYSSMLLDNLLSFTASMLQGVSGGAAGSWHATRRLAAPGTQTSCTDGHTQPRALMATRSLMH
jgi:hypothetical protein